jgi:plasmid stabilization system protein ParE
VAARAAGQIRAVDAWWRENRGGPLGFVDEVAHAIDLLLTSPELGALYEPKAAFGVRRILLPKSQHYLYYVFHRSRGTLRILSVWSCHRGRPPQLGSLKRSRGTTP